MKDYKHSVQPSSRFTGIKRLKKPLLFSLSALVLIPAAILAVRKGAEAVAVHATAAPAAPALTGERLFPVACSLLPNATEQSGNLTATAPDGTQLRYSINVDLQQRMQAYLDAKRPPYALFIALEPATGRIISLNASSTTPDWDLEAAYRLFPMASLFKMVTAAAALEQSKITPTTEVAYRGRAISENPNNWDPRPRGASLKMDVTTAMAKSVNPIYGKLASDLLGRDSLAATCANFGFNRQLTPGIPAAPSQAAVPETVHGLRLMGSGLDHNLKVSPLHAAAITAAIANNGVMMTPRLIDSTVKDGKEVPLPPPHELTRVVNPKVAGELRQMLSTTVTNGTSGKAFRTHDGRRLLSAMQVAAKTGTINGDAPAGQYTWFAAYAPAEKPKIALVALVINDGKWRIKASNVGEFALTSFFREEVAQAAPAAVSERPTKDLKKKRAVKNGRTQVVRKKNNRSNHRGKAA